jgi:hypothetical protein
MVFTSKRDPAARDLDLYVHVHSSVLAAADQTARTHTQGFY